MYKQGSLFDDDMVVAAVDSVGCGVSHLTQQRTILPPPPPSCIHRKCQSRGNQITDGYCINPGKNRYVCKPCMDDFDRWIAWDKKKRDDEWNKALKSGWFQR